MRNFQINFITNTATIRWLKILMAFEKNYQCSTQGLAKITGSTTRTIVTDITDLKEYFGDCLSIDSSHKGYIFSIKQSAVYLTKKRALIADEILFHIIESIFHNDLYSSSEWAEKYHISESTVLRYLRKVQPIFSFYRLEIQTNPICFLGEEINIRKFFHDFYYESEITAHTIFPPIAIQNITASAFSRCYQLDQHACSFGEFNYYLYITFERHFAGQRIELPKQIKKLFEQYNDFRLFSEINEAVSEQYQKELPHEEVLYLFLLVKARRSISNLAIEQNFCREYNHWPEIKQLAAAFVKDCLPDTQDSARDRLLVESFFTVAKIKQLLSPLLNHMISDTVQFVEEAYTDDYHLFKNYLLTQPLAREIWDSNTLEHLGTSLTMYVTSIKSLYWQAKKNIAFLFEGPFYLCQLLKCKSVRYLRSSRTFYFPDSNELSAGYLEKNQIDLIVTNYTEYITEYAQDIDYLLFKTFPDEHDWEALEETLNANFNP